MTRRSDPFRVRMQGPLACFTRPEMKVERVSYEVMTPSAARGAIQGVLWKPQICWHIRRIEVLAPIRWISFRRNEVQTTMSPRSEEIFIEDERTQRNTVALRDVDYVVEAWFELTRRAGEGDSVAKYVEMFRRRLTKGQHHYAPYFGCREFAAELSLAGDTPPPVADADRPLGLMFYDFDWPDFDGGEKEPNGQLRPLFFDARLAHGVLHVPLRSEVRAHSQVVP